MKNARVSIENFDSYDRFLLWTALKSGRRYAIVKEGVQGYCVAGFPREGPSDIKPGFRPNAKLIQLDEIDGLSAAAPQPSLEPGAWLQSIAPGYLV